MIADFVAEVDSNGCSRFYWFDWFDWFDWFEAFEGFWVRRFEVRNRSVGTMNLRT